VSDATAPVRGLHMAHFARLAAQSAKEGIFTLNDIGPHAGIADPQNMQPEDVDKAVRFDLAFDALKRELVDRVAADARPANSVVVLTNGAAQHPPAVTAGFYADINRVKGHLHNHTAKIHSAHFEDTDAASLGLQWALVNEAFQKGVPVIFAESAMTEHDRLAVSRMVGRGHGYVRAETMAEASGPMAAHE
jgi:hypothetical protein